MRKQEINYDGKTFYTYTALAMHYGVSMTTFSRRKKEYPDLGIEYWLTGILKQESLDKLHTKYSIEYQGRYYKNYTVLCKTLGLNYKTVLNRRKLYPDLGIDYWITGKKPKGYVNPQRKPKKNKHNLTYKGKTYSNYDELCDDYNLPKKTFEKRRYKYPTAPLEYCILGDESGYNPIQDLKSKLKLHYGGKIYISIEDICEEYNVSKKFFDARFDKNPYGDLDFFLNIDDKAVNSKEVKHNGIWYKSYKDLVDELGVQGFYSRKGKNPEGTLNYWLYGQN